MLRTGLVGAAVCVVFTLSAAAQEIYYPGNGVSLPTVTKEIHLLGPAQASVGIDCIVDDTGRVTAATVVDSPDPALNDAAVRAVRQWEFKPGTRNNRPVAVRIFVQVRVERL
jgi:TonB family protein